jgi:nucleoprotein TPR
MQEIIRYLREEKTITEMQMDLCQRESKRLKGELDHTKAQLEQTREKLEEERRSQVAKVQNATTHTQLMQTINELNLNRESNVTLRNQYESAQKQLNQKIKEVENLILQLEPIQTRVREVEHELESKDGELKLLQEDRDHWQKRTQDIIQKYDRIDPAELEGFKTHIINLEAERDALIAMKQELESSVEEKITAAQEERNKFWGERRANLIEQSKSKVRELNDVIKKLNTQLATANEDQSRISFELTNANDELSRVRNELEQTRVARDQAFEQANQKIPTPVDAAEEGQVHEGLSEEAKTAYETRIARAEAQTSAEAEKAAHLEQDLQRVRAQVQGFNSQVVCRIAHR